jgi:hypothetical protein
MMEPKLAAQPSGIQARNYAVNPKSRKRLVTVLRNPAWISFIWFGMTAGVSMLATPVRFSAATITRPIALDVGRVVFAALNKAEFVALIILLIVVRVSGQTMNYIAVTGVLALIVLAQAIWLLPELAARTDLIISGVEPGPSIVHGAYSIMELTKLALLLYLGFRSLQLLIDQGSGSD